MDETTRLTWILNYIITSINGLRILENSFSRITEDGSYRIVE